MQQGESDATSRERLQAKSIQGKKSGPHLLITAGVHGDEYEGIEAIRKLIEIVAEDSLRGKLTLIPVVNEAAYRLRSRTADDGKDLARTCPGSSVGTITERIADRLSEAIRSAEYYIDLHTGGFKYRLLPLVGYVLHRNGEILDQQRRMARAFGLPVIWGTNPDLEGRSLSVARDAGVPALYAEHGGGGGSREEGVRDYVRGCLNVMKELGMLEGNPEGGMGAEIVEDDRPESGHLQIQHPAPCDGYFRTAMELGDSIQTGETLGWIVDPPGNILATVKAQQTGKVLMLAACPIVERGDALGVILEQRRS